MKKLDQLRQESKEIKDKIYDKKERLRQLKNQEKKDIKTKYSEKKELIDS